MNIIILEKINIKIFLCNKFKLNLCLYDKELLSNLLFNHIMLK
jgi:hypothetical protein